MLELSEKQIMINWDYTKPLVSIECIAFNQESYIEQCLNGFLLQKTDFPFEIVVHDDASKDNTANIIRKYESKFPNIIKAIYETENQYSKKDGSLSRIIAKKLSGKYLAFCEGDDYWCSEDKLQKQFDFMEKNSEYSVVGHLTKSVNLDGTEVKTFVNVVPGEYTYVDHEKWRLFAHVSSIFCVNYHKILSEEEIEKYYACSCPGDRKIILLLWKLGKAYVLPHVDSVYRYQSGPDSFVNEKTHLRIDYFWTETNNLSRYAKSIGYDFNYDDRKKSLLAFALILFIKRVDKDSYLNIKKSQESYFLCDFIKSMPIFTYLLMNKITGINEK